MKIKFTKYFCFIISIVLMSNGWMELGFTLFIASFFINDYEKFCKEEEEHLQLKNKESYSD